MKKNKAQRPPITLHWPMFAESGLFTFPLQQELPALPGEEHQPDTPHHVWVSTADPADAEGTHNT